MLLFFKPEYKANHLVNIKLVSKQEDILSFIALAFIVDLTTYFAILIIASSIFLI